MNPPIQKHFQVEGKKLPLQLQLYGLLTLLAPQMVNPQQEALPMVKRELS